MANKKPAPPAGPPLDLLFEKGLPSAPDAEKFVLGSILLGSPIAEVQIEAEDFSLEKHRRIFLRMKELDARGEKIDRVTLANELMSQGQIESVDGFSYLISLDEGLPQIGNIDSYCRIVQEKSRLRQLIFAAQKTIDQALMQDTPAAEIATEATERLVEIQTSGGDDSQGGRQTPLQVIENYPGGISTFLDPSKRAKGLPSGFTLFDDMVGGFQPGEIYMIAARPGMGKTSWGLNVAEHLALHPRERRHVAIFSLEMTSDSLITRMACARARVDQARFRRGLLEKEERSRLQFALSEIIEARFSFYDKASTSIGEMSRNIRRLVDKEGLHFLIVDYIQLMGSRKAENRNQELGYISREFKLLAKSCAIPILLLSQLSRITDRRGGSSVPQLSDLRDSGNLEEDSSLVGFLYREEIYKPDREDLKGVAELIISKHRNGQTGKIPLRFIGRYTRFENRAEELPEQE